MGWIGHISEKISEFSGTIPHHPVGLAKISSCFHAAEAAAHLASPRSLVKNSLIDAQMEKADVPVMFQSDGTRMGFLDWPEFWHLPLEKTERPCGLLSTSFDPFCVTCDSPLVRDLQLRLGHNAARNATFTRSGRDQQQLL